MTLSTADDFLIDQTLSNIFADPELTAGPFLSASVASEGNVVGAESIIEASLELKSGLPAQSTFLINLPDSVFYEAEDGSDIKCTINSQTFSLCKEV